MTISATTVTSGTILPYRLHVRDAAKVLGWTVKQTSTSTDTFTKGALTILASYGSGQLVAGSVLDGKSMVKDIKGNAKLQQLATALGAKMGPEVLFTSKACPEAFKLTSKQLAALKARAAKGEVKVIAEAKPQA